MGLTQITRCPSRRRASLNWPWLLRLRRTAGLLAFFYARLHFITYHLVRYRFFDFDDIPTRHARQASATFRNGGLSAAFVLLIPRWLRLHDAIIRRIGARNLATRSLRRLSDLPSGRDPLLVAAKRDITQPGHPRDRVCGAG